MLVLAQISQVQHVVIVIQENRTADNLFGSDAYNVPRKLPGAHFATQGQCWHYDSNQNKVEETIPLYPDSLATCYDPSHQHGDWSTMWDQGAMDGACQVSYGTKCTPTTYCPHSDYWTYCPQMTYVDNTEHIIDPYFQIAQQFGYANYMFQTNQGPSFPAHQFLFSGSSAPVGYSSSNPPTCKVPGNQYKSYPCYKWFDSENVTTPVANGHSGCLADYENPAGSATWGYALDIDPNIGDPEYAAYTPSDPKVAYLGFPCYTHNTLIDLFPQTVTWKYYARSASDLWTAPTAYDLICQPSGPGPSGTCTGPAYTNNPPNVIEPNSSYYPGDEAPILTDIQKCALASVNWVIPDGNWSDHAGDTLPGDAGPSWVAAIVNAIGQDTTCESGAGYWSDTVILITWDDWGGYYDDILPPDCAVPNQNCTGYSNGTGQQYVYGFRVPLLVVGAYAIPGYVSGANINSPNCAPPSTYCHDFGSILNFTEYAFGLPQGGIGNAKWPFADALVMDTQPSPPNNYSLYDFFQFNKPGHTFKPITGAKYPPSCFHTPISCWPSPSVYPAPPDSD